MRGKIVLALLVLTVIALVLALRYRQSHAPSQTKRSWPGKPEVTSPGSSTTFRDTREDAIASGPFAADSTFQSWIRREAQALDEPSVDSQKKTDQLREIVSKLNPAQVRQLRQTITDPRTASREKILSAYMLVEGGPRTRQELQEAIAAPLNQTEPPEPHTVEETNGVREKSLRIMMIDGLYAQAQRDPAARTTLAKVITESTDPYLKTYAQEKYDQLPQP